MVVFNQEICFSAFPLHLQNEGLYVQDHAMQRIGKNIFTFSLAYQ